MAAHPLTLSLHRGRIQLEMQVHALGEDLLVILTGGDRPHLGAVAVAASGPSAPFEASLSMPRHKEETLCRELAGYLSRELEKNVGVAAGIHLDKIRPEEIAEVLEMSRELIGQAIVRLKEG